MPERSYGEMKGEEGALALRPPSLGFAGAPLPMRPETVLLWRSYFPHFVQRLRKWPSWTSVANQWWAKFILQSSVLNMMSPS